MKRVMDSRAVSLRRVLSNSAEAMGSPLCQTSSWEAGQEPSRRLDVIHACGNQHEVKNVATWGPGDVPGVWNLWFSVCKVHLPKVLLVIISTKSTVESQHATIAIEFARNTMVQLTIAIEWFWQMNIRNQQLTFFSVDLVSNRSRLWDWSV